MRSINLQNFLLIPLMVSESYRGQSSKCKNEQRAINTKFGKAEFKFLCTSTHWDPSTYKVSCFIYYSFFELCPGQDFPKRGDNWKSGQNRVMAFILPSPSMPFTTVWSLNKLFPRVFKLMSQSYFPDKIFLKREINKNLGETEWLFGTALLFHEIFLPTKFHVDISYNFRVMSQTKFKK
jgi:hypothetical protein